MKKRLFNVMLMLVFVAGMMLMSTIVAEAEETKQYACYNIETKSYDMIDVPSGWKPVNSIYPYWGTTDDPVGYDPNFMSEWYIATGEITFNERIYVHGHVNLVLGKKCKLYAKKGIDVEAGNSLTIYTESDALVDWGMLDADASGVEDCAGIGSGENAFYYDEDNCGDLIVHGGLIYATGCKDAAGIGGGYGANGGNVTIYGGKVEAHGGEKGAGIGGGSSTFLFVFADVIYYGGNGGKVKVYDGSVKAYGGRRAAGIGCGDRARKDGGKVTVYGGNVIAHGGDFGAGIGGGLCSGFDDISACGANVEVYDGTVKAYGGIAAAGIGGGVGMADHTHEYFHRSKGGTFKIYGGSVEAYGGSGATIKNYGYDDGLNENEASGSGAGIGGSTLCYGADIYLYGGKVTAIGGSHSKDGKDVLGKAFGRGYHEYDSRIDDGSIHIADGHILISEEEETKGQVLNTGFYTASSWPDYFKDKSFLSFKIEDNEPVSYLYTAYTLEGPRTETKYDPVEQWNTNWNKEWYVLNDSGVYDEPVTVTGKVNLIIENGKTLETKAGIRVEEGASLSIYGQSTDENEELGKLIATAPENIAAIDGTAGTVIIQGADITATGSENAAAIGGGNGEDGGIFKIYGGILHATGGENGAAIGGGNGADGGESSFFGGTTVAESRNGAAIGGGYGGNGGKVNLNGGKVTATSVYGAAIGGGDEGDGGEVTISGGENNKITSVYGAAIGGGFGGNGGTLMLRGGVTEVHSLTRAIGGGDKIDATFKPGTITVGSYYNLKPRVTADGEIITKEPDQEWINILTGKDYYLTVSKNSNMYLDYDSETGEFVEATAEGDVLKFDKEHPEFVGGTWTVIDEDVEFNGIVPVGGQGNANLILCDGCTLTINGGIFLCGVKLAIYAQSQGENMGSLIVNGVDYAAGIGGYNNTSCGDLYIYGGNITANGGKYAAGIGGGGDGIESWDVDKNENPIIGEYARGGNVYIYGGNVRATGGEKAAGIGAGESLNAPVSAGKIKIYGGDVYAEGGGYAAGIGGGNKTEGGEIEISGGKVEAVGGAYNVGIGGIGGTGDTVSSIAIKNCKVTATGGDLAAGIGDSKVTATGGDLADSSTVVTIYKADVTARGTARGAGINGNIMITDSVVQADGGEGGNGMGGHGIYGNGGQVVITDSTVAATGGRGYAGIGGEVINITNSKVTATGGQSAAGIGGNSNTSCTSISINGGEITATGNNYGAGIGGDSGNADITIYGGTITATGGTCCAGIGGGDGYTGDVTIHGGDITATGGWYGGAGIGGGRNGNGIVKIYGGTINATGGTRGGSGIGGGLNGSGDVMINDGMVDARGGDAQYNHAVINGEDMSMAYPAGPGIGNGGNGTGGNTKIFSGTVNAYGGASEKAHRIKAADAIKADTIMVEPKANYSLKVTTTVGGEGTIFDKETDIHSTVANETEIHVRVCQNSDIRPEGKYLVRFDRAGHGNLIPTQTVEKDGKVEKPADPTEEKRVFGGWYKEKSCITEWDFDTDTVTSDITLYAKWTIQCAKADLNVVWNGDIPNDVTAIMVSLKDSEYRFSADISSQVDSEGRKVWTSDTQMIPFYYEDGIPADYCIEEGSLNENDIDGFTFTTDVHDDWDEDGQPVIHFMLYYDKIENGKTTISGTINWVDTQKQNHDEQNRMIKVIPYIDGLEQEQADIREMQWIGSHFSIRLPSMSAEGKKIDYQIDMPDIPGYTKIQSENSYDIKYTDNKINCYHKSAVEVEAKHETCTEAGNRRYYHCPDCLQDFEDKDCTQLTDAEDYTIPAGGHNYGRVTYVWDDKDCTATRTCWICEEGTEGHTDTMTVTGSYEKDTDATCTTAEKGHYIATFGKTDFADQKTAANSVINGDPLGHGTPVTKNAKAATVEAEGYSGDKVCPVCGTVMTKGSVIPKLTPQQGDVKYDENKILSKTTDTDPAGSTFKGLTARIYSTAKTSITIRWKKVSGATAYYVYAARCNTSTKKYQFKKIATVKPGTYKCKYSKLKKGTYYKFIVMAVKGSKTVSISKALHIATKGGKVTNIKSLTLNKTKVSVKKGKKVTIKVKKKTLYSSKLKSKTHRGIKYESSNKKIATVSAKGVIKGIKKGKCIIYVYAQDGAYKKVAVTVK